jgi:hypothetical protein
MMGEMGGVTSMSETKSPIQSSDLRQKMTTPTKTETNVMTISRVVK